MTEAQAPTTTPAKKLLGGLGVKVRLAAACGLVLGVGALFAPRTAPTALAPSQERAAPLLEEQVQLRDVVRPFRGVQDVAARIREHGVAIPPARDPASATLSDYSDMPDRWQASGFGVFVSDTYVLTHAGALDGRSTVALSTADDGWTEGRLAAYEPSSGLVLLETEPSGRPAVPLAGAPPDPGMLAVAVGRSSGRDVAVPVFVTSVADDHYTVGALDGAVPPGMPVYNLDGELFAVTAGSDRGGVAFPVLGAQGRLAARASAGGQLSLGIVFQEITGALTRAFGEKGVLISDVPEGGPAHAAGIQSGDVLLAVGDLDVSTPVEATRAAGAAEAGTTMTLHLLRGRRARSVEVSPIPAYDMAALAVADVAQASAGLEARGLTSAQILERAGIPATARVLRLNGRPAASRAQAARELRGRQPVTVLLRLDGRQFFAVIEPAP